MKLKVWMFIAVDLLHENCVICPYINAAVVGLQKYSFFKLAIKLSHAQSQAIFWRKKQPDYTQREQMPSGIFEILVIGFLSEHICLGKNFPQHTTIVNQRCCVPVWEVGKASANTTGTGVLNLMSHG